MGTYMSAFIEIDYGERAPPFSDHMQVYSLTEGSFRFGKDYEVFDALAEGRNSQMRPEDRDPDRAPLITPRGMPSPRSLTVAQDYFFLVADPADPPNEHFWPAHRCVSPAEAEEWLESKGSHESEMIQWFNCEPGGRVWRVVSEPGLYNATWLRPNEFDAALRYHDLEPEELPVEYTILRHAMSLLGERNGPERVRMVLWFS